jgi:hypothetical protein
LVSKKTNGPKQDSRKIDFTEGGFA